MIKILMILLFSLSLSAHTYCQYTSNQAIVNSFSLDQLKELGCADLECEPLKISRTNSKTYLILEFPLGGTQTDVYLIELERYRENILNPKELDYATLRHDSKSIMEGQPLILNLTKLQDGIYLVRYTSCNSASQIPIELITDSE
jgi:hypothetical protein